MTTFSATVDSTAVVDAPRADLWKALTDPGLLPELTPFLRRIDADGDTWTWQMRPIAALGVDLTPVFTEEMSFDEGRTIVFTHRPPAGASERAGADGRYELSDAGNGTNLSITLKVEVELPLPKAATPAVTRVMKKTMAKMGDRFSDNLIRHVGG